MDIQAREFEILYENKISERRTRVYADMNKMYWIIFLKNHNSFIVTLEISHLIKRIRMDTILDTENVQRDFGL